jgi:tRNA nucleotidyltransferase (CCA-adding enzyme)
MYDIIVFDYEIFGGYLVEIIASHLNLDFDGLASMIAASKLYPRAKMVLPEKINISVREFLALYKDVFPLYQQSDISFAEIKKLIVVDTNSSERLGKLLEEIPTDTEIEVWDHHPNATDRIYAKKEIIQSIGATTTLLVERIKSQNITLTSFEATTFALGIYSDTGSLIFGTTTARDVHAVAFLLEQGANLGVVSRFLEIPLENDQQELLHDLMENMKTITCKGLKVLLSYHKGKDYIGGLSLLAHKLIELTGAEILFLTVEMAGKVFIIGRSSSDSLDVNSILKKFGGGGHKSAGAAVIKNGQSEKIYTAIEEEVKREIKPSVTAHEIMSSPVKTILPSTTMKSAAAIMLRYGHTGLPVVEDGKLLGIISRRDIDKALHHGLGHAPVKAYMSKNVKTASITTSLSEIQNLMIENNIGRLPILKDGKLVGIVTRSDVLSRIHGENIHNNTLVKDCQIKKSDIKRKMINTLPAKIYDILVQLGNIAEEADTNVYLVGGMVRDLLLDKENKDLDIVVEGEGIEFAEKVAKYFGVKIKRHKEFGTSTLELNEDLKLDIVTARSEFYAYPAALPQVEKAFLRQDLDRRDFTINSMAICLNKERFGTLIDYYCGYSDLQKGLIKILHNLSFVEDPTRILRAVRFETRLGFSMDPDTFSLAVQAVEELKNLSKPRLGDELRAILQEQNAIKSIFRLQELEALEYILGEPLQNKELFRKVYETIQKAHRKKLMLKPYLLYLGSLAVDSENAFRNLSAMGLYKEEITFLKKIKGAKRCERIFKNLPDKPGDVHKHLKDLNIEICLFIPLILGLDPVIDKVIVYLHKRQNLKPSVDGKELQKIGIKPGPIYSNIFEELQVALLNNVVNNNKQAELDWVKKYIDNERG